MNPLEKQEGGNHYKGMVIQPVEYITKNKLGFIEGSVIKYVSRHRQKNGAEDIKKAIHFLELLLKLEYDFKPPTAQAGTYCPLDTRPVPPQPVSSTPD